jgi:hypothetical protein
MNETLQNFMAYPVMDSMTLYEHYDKQKLDILIKNFEELYPVIGKFRDLKNGYKKIQDKNQNKTILENLYKSKRVLYKPSTNSKDGRLFGSNSLQGINRIVRHTLCKDIYYDYDIKNCHNVLFEFYCNNLKIPLYKLKQNNANREEYLKELMDFYDIERDDAKDIVLKILNGGGIKENHPEWLYNLKLEIDTAHSIICELDFNKDRYKKICARKQFNTKGSTINAILCKMENIIIQCFYNWCIKNDIEVGTLCFDGLLVKNKIDCSKIEEHIYKELGIKLEIVEKEMNEGIDLSKYQTYDYSAVNNYIKQLNDEIDFDDLYSYKKFIDNIVSIDMVEKLFKNTIIQFHNGGKNPNMITKKQEWNDKFNKFVYIYTMDVNLKGLMCMIKNPVRLKTDINSLSLIKKKKEREELANSHFLTLTLDVILDNMIFYNKLDWYDGVIFEPYFLEPNRTPHKFNLFKGFALLQDNTYFDNKNSSFEDSLIYKHICIHLCNNDKIAYTYLLDFIAHMIQKPYEKTDQIIAIVGPPGGFKDGIVEFISKLLDPVDEKYSVIYNKIDNYFKAFNKDKEGKLLIAINELAEGSKDNEAFKRHNELKGDITAKQIRIEPKGVDPYYVKDYARRWASSNFENSLYIENTDRRYVMIKTSSNDEINANSTYFAPLFGLLNNIEFIKDAFAYFALRDISNFNPHMAPNTEFKEEQKLRCLNNSLTFLKDIWIEYDIDEEFKIHTEDLYSLFRHYCKKNGIGGAVKKSTFIDQISKIGLKQLDPTFRYSSNELGCSFNDLYSYDKVQKSKLSDIIIMIYGESRPKYSLKKGYLLSKQDIKRGIQKHLKLDFIDF